jgi:hypothetical protein
VAIGGPKPRSLLVLLLLNAGRAVPSGQRRSQRSRPG